MCQAMTTIVPLLITAFESNEGVSLQLKDDVEESAFSTSDVIDDEDDLSPMDKDEDDDLAGYTVENDFIEEKEEACLALRELALHAR